ncbi:tetratricopeptide repeat protein [Parasediminibacterium paludis]|uniref:Tetratricopeptide repeat protein n=1 Tax=Parasediminibacterium paludis TaxID=908966 RepID=A0ABV8PYW9_9BACT
MKVNCSACGALNETFDNKCQYCSSSLKIETNSFENKIKVLNQQGNKFKLAEIAFEGENYDEAISYYNACLEIDPDFFEAWYKKGLSQLFSSTVGKLNSNQCVATLKRALNSAPNRKSMSMRISKEIIPFLNNYTNIIINHFSKFGPEHISFMVDRKAQSTIFLIDFCNLSESQLKFLFEDYKNLHKGIKKAAISGIAARGGRVDKNNSVAVYNQMYKVIESLGDSLLKHVIKFDPQAKKISKTECFIATAVMGKYDHPVVLDLRFFRDEWLLKRKWGAEFTSWYYTHGPGIADLIEKSSLLKNITFIFIIKPLHLVSKFLTNFKINQNI